MKWIILIGNQSFNLQDLDRLEHPDCVGRGYLASYHYHVTYKDGYISYFDDDIAEDYEEWEQEEIPYENPHFVLMRYSGHPDKVLNVLKQKDFPKDVLVDDDHGFIGPVSQFLDSDLVGTL